MVTLSVHLYHDMTITIDDTFSDPKLSYNMHHIKPLLCTILCVACPPTLLTNLRHMYDLPTMIKRCPTLSVESQLLSFNMSGHYSGFAKVNRRTLLRRHCSYGWRRKLIMLYNPLNSGLVLGCLVKVSVWSHSMGIELVKFKSQHSACSYLY